MNLLEDLKKLREAKPNKFESWFGNHEKRQFEDGEWETLDNGNQRTYYKGYLLIHTPEFAGSVKDGAGKILDRVKGRNIKDVQRKLMNSKELT